MGCDTWTSSDLPVLWNWSGSSGSPITITVDKTWYNATACPSAWNRPIWDAGGATMSPLNDMFVAGYSGATSWGVLDNIEMIDLYSTGGGAAAYEACYEGCENWIFSNIYAHKLKIVLDGACNLFAGAGSSISGNLWTNIVVNGADASGQNPAGAVCYAFGGVMGGDIKNSVIHDVANGFVGGAPAGGSPMTISGNLIYNIKESNASVHPNAIEVTGPNSTSTYYVHDNFIHDLVAGVEAIMLGNPGETDYVWNNVISISSGGSAPDFPQASGSPGVAAYYWNNTIIPPSGASCFYQNGGNPTPTVVIQNNHCITTGAVATGFTSGSLTVTNNLLQTPSQADANISPNYDQYTSSETYVYSPVASTNSTVGYGTNLTGDCSGLLAGLCSDTDYAVIYDSTAQTTTSPGRTQNSRPASGAWDAGAYQSGDPPGPEPPSKVQAIPH
jgi:hypothetical protein